MSLFKKKEKKTDNTVPEQSILETNEQAPDQKMSEENMGETVIAPDTSLFNDMELLEKNIKKNSKTGKNKKKKMPETARTAQQSIPFLCVYESDMMEVEEGKFSKTYRVQDVNFKIATQEEQENIFALYGDLLNTFGPDVGIEVTIYNRTLNSDFSDKIFLNMKNDGLDNFREEYNNMLTEKMREGRNNLTHEKYITLTIESESAEAAEIRFSSLEIELSSAVRRINEDRTDPMTTSERLAILSEIYHSCQEFLPLGMEREIYGNTVNNFDISTLRKLGLTTKDVVAPDALEWNLDYFRTGTAYGRVLYLNNLPSYLSTDLMSDISGTPVNMLVSVHFSSIPQDKAMKLLRDQIVNINGNVIERQKQASKAGYGHDLISPTLMKAKEDAQKIFSDMTTRNQKLFLTTFVVAHFAPDKETLDKDTKSIISMASKNLCSLKKLQWQQETGLATALPIGRNCIAVDRMLTTESACAYIPFEAQEMSQENGMYYGLNAVSKNLILFNRINSQNGNGVILGTPGSGKSFAAKREIVNILLNTNDEVYIIDPEREYQPLADIFGGTTVRMAAGSNVHINPFDMDLDYSGEKGDDPITLKSDYITALCETMVGGRFGLSPIQKSIIDRCVKLLYDPYLEKMNALKKKGITCDESLAPTMRDFYSLLLEQKEPEAKNLAVSIELYTKGSFDTFAHRTNVDTKNRFVIYDIKDLGTSMKELGLSICLNHIWNKMIANKKHGRWTWFYIDEFYLLVQTEASCTFLKQVWKRARKWGGFPTGITQNVEDLLASKEASTILSNSDFVMMLRQAPLDKDALAKMFNISQTQLSYITSSDSGQGLIYNGRTIVPFVDKFPTDTKLYRAMTTKPGEKLDV